MTESRIAIHWNDSLIGHAKTSHTEGLRYIYDWYPLNDRIQRVLELIHEEEEESGRLLAVLKLESDPDVDWVINWIDKKRISLLDIRNTLYRK